jgi:hypothetical protein
MKPDQAPRMRQIMAVARIIREKAATGMTDLSELRRLNGEDGIVVDGESVKLNDDEWELASAGLGDQ